MRRPPQSLARMPPYGGIARLTRKIGFNDKVLLASFLLARIPSELDYSTSPELRVWLYVGKDEGRVLGVRVVRYILNMRLSR